MTIQSMTGFGTVEVSAGGWTMKAQCRSVNHKGLDIRVWSPRDWTWVEPFVLEQARAAMCRGRLEVRVDCSPTQAGATLSGVNTKAFADVAAELTRHAVEAGLAHPSVSDVLGFDAVRTTASELALPEDLAPFEQCIIEAIAALVQSRADEGQRLRATMDGLVDEVATRVREISAAAALVGDEYRTRLEQRMTEALSRYGLQEIDEHTVLQEVALYVDRSDISEELQRATSHVHKLREVFATAPGSAIGKQIDFYLQELFREANTTGSKSGSVAITDHVIAMKTAIEQMREQAANIE